MQRYSGCIRYVFVIVYLETIHGGLPEILTDTGTDKPYLQH